MFVSGVHVQPNEGRVAEHCSGKAWPRLSYPWASMIGMETHAALWRGAEGVRNARNTSNG